MNSEYVLITVEIEGNVQMECVYVIQAIKDQTAVNKWSVKLLRDVLMAVQLTVLKNAIIRKSAVY